MRLAGKRLLLLVADGVDLDEYRLLRKGFESEDAVLFCTAPENYGTVESVSEGKRGEDIVVDIPLEAVEGSQFQGLIIPDGIAAIESLRRDRNVIELIRGFHQRSRAIFASGRAVQLLQESGVLSNQIVVREGEALESFVDRAVDVLLDIPFVLYGKRAASA